MKTLGEAFYGRGIPLFGEIMFWVTGGYNPFRALKLLRILIPSIFVPKTGFQP